MDDPPPMRPVSVPPDEPKSPSLWVYVVYFGAVVSIAATMVLVDSGRWWAFALATLLIAVGGAMAVFADRGVRYANRGHRLPLFFGVPPVQRRGLHLMSGAGMSLIMVGAATWGRNGDVFWALPIIVVSVVVMSYSALAIVLHNRRATSDA